MNDKIKKLQELISTISNNKEYEGNIYRIPYYDLDSSPYCSLYLIIKDNKIYEEKFNEFDVNFGSVSKDQIKETRSCKKHGLFLCMAVYVLPLFEN